MGAFAWIRQLVSLQADNRSRFQRWDRESLAPHLQVKRLEERRVLNADAAPVEALVIDAGSAAADGQADTYVVEQHEDHVHITVNGQEVSRTPISQFGAIHIRGSNDDDILIAEFKSGEPLAGLDLLFEGGGGNDTLTLNGDMSAQEVAHEFGDTDLSHIGVESSSGTATIAHVGVEAVQDNLAAENRTFRFESDSEQILLSDFGSSHDDLSRILTTDGTEHSELSVVFKNPTNSLGIETNTSVESSDSVELAGVDGNFDADLLVSGSSEDLLVVQGAMDVGSGDVEVVTGTIRIENSLTSTDASFSFQAQHELIVGQDGVISNERGSVDFEAPSIVHDGIIAAQGGETRLDSGDDGVTVVRGVIDVSTNTAAGELGGTVQVLGAQVALLDGARIDASGAGGGGKILVGGDYQGSNAAVRNARQTYVGSDVVILANATVAGMGGTVIIWANEMAAVYGTISARGGAMGGDGGFVETSGKQYLDFQGSVDASATHGAAGTWLLDPEDVTIDLLPNANVTPMLVGGELTFTFIAQDVASTIGIAGIVAALNAGNNVTIVTDGTITVAAAIAKALDAGGDGSVLTLNAVGTITVNALAAISSATGALNVVFDTDAGVVINAPITTNGGSFTSTGTTFTNNALGTITTTGGAVSVVHTGLVTLGAAISAGTGAVGISGSAIAQNANITTGGTGTVNVTASAGGITMADLTTTTTATGSITYQASTNVALSALTSTSGPISVTATAGSISDITALETANLSTSGTATLSGSTGIGSAEDINTTIGTLVATNSTSGNIRIEESSGLTIGGTGVRTLAGNGNIDIDVNAGALTVNSVVTAHGTGTVTLNADAGTVDLNAITSSTTGAIAITGNIVTQDANITTGGTGTVNVTADTGDITMASGTTTSATGSGNITYTASNSVALGLLSSSTGNVGVTATAGSITDNNATANNISAVGLSLTADDSIGAITPITGFGVSEVGVDSNGAGNAIEIAVTSLTSAAADVIHLVHTGALTIAAGAIDIAGAAAGTAILQATGNLNAGSIALTGGDSLALISGATLTIPAAGFNAGAGNLRMIGVSDVVSGGNLVFAADDLFFRSGGASGDAVLDTTVATITARLATNDITINETDDITLTEVTVTSGDATIDAGGAILGGNVSATNLEASAVNGITLDTNVATLTATNSTTGNISIEETSGLTIDGTGVRTLAGNGNIDIDVNAGGLTVDAVVTAHGTGTVTLNADAGTVDLNAVVSSTTGAIAITGNIVTQDANITTGGTGTVNVTADVGNITMASGTTTSTATGNITYSADDNVALSLLTSTTGNIEVTADTAAILDNLAGETANLITGGTATLSGATGIGSADNINTTIGTLVATNSTSGDIRIEESSGLVIGGTGVRTLAGNGNIDIDVNAGELIVNSVVTAHGSGTVTLNAVADTVDLNAVVSSTTGAISVTGNAVTQDANITTGGTGTVSVTADAGGIAMADLTTTTTATGSITYQASTGVALSLLTSTSGPISVTATASSISDITALETANLSTSGTATLSGSTGIGSAEDINTTIGTLVATNSTSGDIRIEESSGLTIGGTGVRTLAGNGNINIDVNAGALTVNSVVTAHGTGTVTINADAGTVDLNAVVSSTAGAIDITGDIVTQDANITTGDMGINEGTVNVTADVGDITMASGTTTSTASGNITYTAADDVALSLLSSTAGDVDVTATAGSITDNNGTANNISGVDLSLTADDSIGTINTFPPTGFETSEVGDDSNLAGNAIEIAVTSITSAAADAIHLVQSGALTIAAGAINIAGAAAGTAILQATGNLNAGAVGSIALTGDDSLALISRAILTIPAAGFNAGTGDLRMIGVSDIAAEGGSNLVFTADDLYFRSGGAAGDELLNTTVNSITARLAANDITINETNAITLTEVTTTDGDVTVTTSNAGDMTVGRLVPPPPTNGVTAGGTHLVTLTAAGAILDGNGATVNVTATSLDASAVTGITLDTSVDNLVADTTTGNITIEETSGLTINGTGVTTGNGNIDIDVNAAGLNQDANITTDTAGTVNVTVDAGDITMASGTTTTSAGGTITYQAANSVALSALTSTTGTALVTATSGAITDNNAAGLNITAVNLALDAGTGIGTAIEAIDTNVVRFEGEGGTGGLFLVNQNALDVGGVNSLVGASAAGDVNITTLAGDLLNSELVESTTQSVSLTAQEDLGANVSAAINANLTAVTGFVNGGASAGSLFAQAATGIDLNTDVNNITANTVAGSIDIDESDGANVVSVTANAGDADVSSLTGNLNVTTVSALTNVTLNAIAGAIMDNNAATLNISGANLLLNGFTGIGSVTDAIDTAVAVFAGTSSTGGLFILDQDSLDISTVNAIVGATADDAVSIRTTTGNLRVLQEVASMTQSVDLLGGSTLAINANVFAMNVTNGTIMVGVGEENLTALTMTAGTFLITGKGMVGAGLFANGGGRFIALDTSFVFMPPPALTLSQRMAEIRVRVADFVDATNFGTDYQITVDWAESNNRYSNPIIDGSDVGVYPTFMGSYAAFTHEFVENPSSNPADDIPITVSITSLAADSINATYGGRPLVSAVDLATGAYTNNAIGIRIGLVIDVLALPTVSPALPPQPQPAAPPSAPVIADTPDVAVAPPQRIRIQFVASSAGVTSEGEERFYELRVVSFDENGLLEEKEEAKIRLDDPKLKAIFPFNPSKLPALFGRLPADRYRIYLIEDGTERLILEFTIEQGQPIEIPEVNDVEPDVGGAVDPFMDDGAGIHNLDGSQLTAVDAIIAIEPSDSPQVLRESKQSESLAERLGNASFISHGGVVVCAAAMAYAGNNRWEKSIDRLMERFDRRRSAPWRRRTESESRASEAAARDSVPLFS